MKLISLFVFVCFITNFVFAQDYLITFSGTGESNTVSSVLVENLTQAKSLTLNGNDVLNLKKVATAVSDIEKPVTQNIRIYPNPLKGFSLLTFTLSKEGETFIELFDVAGRVLLKTNDYLPAGLHDYRLSGTGNGIYLIRVTSGNQFLTGKLISDNPLTGKPELTLHSSIPANKNKTALKNASSGIKEMQYNSGDRLKFTGISGKFKTVVVDIPEGNKTIGFTFYTCTDNDGKDYAIVGAGAQWWMAENLAYLPAVYPPETGSETLPHSYVYGYNGTSKTEAKATQNFLTYGVLYNWPAAMNGAASSNANPSGVRGLCPAGWHLPSEAELLALEAFLGESAAGGKMKETGTTHWQNPNTGATNESGFSALPGGYRTNNGSFTDNSLLSIWWSTSAPTNTEASVWHLGNARQILGIWYYNRQGGLNVRCVKDLLPVITTTTITQITQTAATGGGNVTSDGGGAVTARGVCWSTSQNPTTAINKTTDGTGTGTFTSSITGLTAGTLYYVRAYATNSGGTVYGEEKQFRAKNQTGTFQDPRDNTMYDWVKIGAQTWMAENLAYLPSVSPPSVVSETSPYYYIYGYEGTSVSVAKATSNYSTYGTLYNWQAASSACPAGWHLPGDAEWTTLENYLIANGYNYDGTTTGNKITKSLAATTNWSPSTNTGAIGNNLTVNNTSGFSALPGGSSNGTFVDIGDAGSWWSSSVRAGSSQAWGRYLMYSYADVGHGFYNYPVAFSVRCLRDVLPQVTTNPITGITQTAAASGGNVTSAGETPVIVRGICWSTSQNPTTANSKTTDGIGTGTFTSNLTGLTASTPYYVRAYATNSAGTAYGSQEMFTTSGPTITPPSVTTNPVTAITQTTATGGGIVNSDGGAAVTARGVCWSTSQNPTTANSKTTDGSGTGTFTSNLTGLTASTPYYVRAYATNSAGTSYGGQVPFTSLPVVLPVVTTAEITAIGETIATGGGNVTSDGGGTVTARGVCWSTTSNPTIANNKTTNGTGIGSFTSSLTGLSPGYHYYYVKAYATNSAGTAYGEEKQFRAKNQTGTFQDPRDNVVYDWVKIGNQTWMAENLAYLPLVSPPSAGSATSSYYYVYGYDGADVSAAKATSNYSTYGALYNWPAALTACPSGWHLPTDVEWTILENHMIANGYNYDGTLTGNKIAKSMAATTNWITSTSTGAIGNDLSANNSSGFSAFPGGLRVNDGKFSGIGNTCCFKSSTEYSKNHGWIPILDSWSYEFDGGWSSPFEGGMSVRCIKGDKLSLASVSTNPVRGTTQNTAIGGGNVTSEGGGVVTARGICWSTSPYPTTFGSKTTDGSGTGSFTSSITGLNAGQIYYVRAYAVNGGGTSYGPEVSFSTLPVIPPVITSDSITNIAETSATFAWTLISDGGSTVNGGVVYSSINTNPTPSIDAYSLCGGSHLGSFSCPLSSLKPGTKYFARAFASNSAGTVYGNVLSFRTKNLTGTFTDSRDSKAYNWVQIGAQVWMAQNLAYLPKVSPPGGGSDVDKVYYVYGYSGIDPLMAKLQPEYKTYGTLYNWPAALTACPAGWHLPGDAEWTTLGNYLIANGYNYDGTTTGNKIARSMAATANWTTSTNPGAIGNNLTINNSSGFSALPGGYRSDNGVFNSLGNGGNWWTASENNTASAWNRNLGYSTTSLYGNDIAKTYGISVRCVRD